MAWWFEQIVYVLWKYDVEMLSRSCTVVLWWWNVQQELYSGLMMVKCSAGVVQWSYDGEMFSRSCTVVLWWWNAQWQLYSAIWWWNALQELYNGLMMVKCSGGTVQWSHDDEMLSRSCILYSMLFWADGVSMYVAVPLTVHWHRDWMLSRYRFMTWHSMTLRAEGVSVYNVVPLTAH